MTDNQRLNKQTREAIRRMNQQAIFGDPPACDWKSERGEPCVLERHDGVIHAVLNEHRRQPTKLT